MAEEAGQAYVGIVPSLKGFSAKLRAELAAELRGIDAPVATAGRRAGRVLGEEMGTGLQSTIGRLGAIVKTGLLIGTAGVVAGLGALTGFGLKSAAALEQTQIGLEALLGDASKAKDFIGELQQFAAKTPFEFAGVADASRRILAFGSSVGIAREQVIPTLTTIGDLVSVLGGSQENIDGIIRAFGQVASKGRLMGGEVLQLAEQLPGFNVNAAVAAKLGVSVAEALELQEAGAIDAKTAIDGILEGMAKFPGAAGAMAKQAETLKGVFSTFKDTVSIALTNAFQPVIPAIKQTLTELTPVIGTAIGQLAPALGGFLATLLPAIGQIITGLVPIITPVLGIVSEIVGNISGFIGPLGQAIGTVVAAFAPFGDVLGIVIAALLDSLIPIIVALAPIFAALAPPIVDIIFALLPLIPPLAQLLLLGLQLILPITKLTAALVGFLAVEALAPVLRVVADTLRGVAIPIQALIDLINSINWAAVGDAILHGLGDAAKAVGQWFEDLPRMLTNLTKEAGTWLLEVGKDIVRGLVQGIKDTISDVGDALLNGIRGGVERAGKFLKLGSPSKLTFEMGQDTGQGFVNGVQSMAADASMATRALVGVSSAGAAVAPAPQPITVNSSNPIITAVIDAIREEVRTKYGNKVELALQAS